MSEDCPSQKFGLPGCLEWHGDALTAHQNFYHPGVEFCIHTLTNYLHAYTLLPCNGRRSDRGNVTHEAYTEKFCYFVLEELLNSSKTEDMGWGPKVWTIKNQNGINLENKNCERLNVERPLLRTTFNARDQKFERLKWREVKN